MACTASACLLGTALIASMHSGTTNSYQMWHSAISEMIVKHTCADQIWGCVPQNGSVPLKSLPRPSLYVRAGYAICHFGTLPGGWIRSQEGSPFPLRSEDGEAFPTWQPYSQDCQLEPLLGPYLQVATHCAQCILLLHSCMSCGCM